MPARAPIATAWETYNDREAECRARYLFTVESAHRQYLAGPWPDRDGYDAVERSAWMTYYHACRDAWQEFVQRISATPPVAPAGVPPRVHESISGAGWPASPYDYPQPGFTPNPERT